MPSLSRRIQPPNASEQTMPFSIVIDNDLHFSLLEFAAILDLELKSEDHQYKTTFQQLLDNKKNDEIVSQLLTVQPYFLEKFTRKSFEPSVNLYLHIISLIDPTFESGLISSLIVNIDPTITETSIPVDVILIAVTNIFNLLPAAYELRYTCLALAVKLITKENIFGLIANIAKNIQTWISSIEKVGEEQVSDLLEDVFTRYIQEDEAEAFKTFESIIIENNLPLNSKFLEAFFSQILSSTNIYNLSPLAQSPSFKSIQNASLNSLLSAYLAGDYKSYTANKAQYASLPINFTNLESTLKSLSILNYIASASSSTNTFPYTTLSSELEIPVESVELQLLTLISEGLIVAKLSQSAQAVIVNSVNYTGASLSAKPELVNWSEVNTLLGSWSANIKNLQGLVQTLVAKRGKKINAPPVIMSFHQQKLEAKEAREKKAQQEAEAGSEAAALDSQVNETVETEA